MDGYKIIYKTIGYLISGGSKRLMDLLLSIPALFVLLPLMGVIALLIRHDSPGPAIYRQERLGKRGKPFTLYKFRSMRMDAEKNGAKWASSNDDRCTKLGSKLRQFRLDELPQLINIIRGDMSLVGPRPERAVFYDEFVKTIPDFRDRLAVLPGLTGLAQINGGYDLGPAEKLVWDKKYIREQSLWLDIKIIFKTVLIVFNHDGAR